MHAHACAHTHTHTHTPTRTHTQPPELQHQNGAITHYNIYHRRTPDNNTNSTTAYTLVVYSPETNDSADTNLTILLDDLESGQSYDVKLQAATAVGPGPNTTVYQSQTLTRTYSDLS